MFSRSNESDADELIDDITEQLANALRAIKNSCDIKNDINYQFYLDIKNRLFDGSISFAFAAKAVTAFEIDENSQKAKEFSCIKTDLSDILDDYGKRCSDQKDNEKVTTALAQRYLGTEKESAIRQTINKQLAANDDAKVLKDELCILAIHELGKQSGFSCQLINVLQLKENSDTTVPMRNSAKSLAKALNLQLANVLDQILAQNTQQNINRVSIMLREGVHYYALDFNIQLKSCILLDASADTRKMRMHQVIELLNNIDTLIDIETLNGYMSDENIIKKHNLQLDGSRCVYFALDHAFQARQCDGLHENLLKKMLPSSCKNVYKVDWVNAPFVLVKNTQSTQLIKHYIKTNPDSEAEVNTLTNKNSKCYALDHTCQMIQSAVKACLTLTDNEIVDILSKNSCKDTKLSTKVNIK